MALLLIIFSVVAVWSVAVCRNTKLLWINSTTKFGFVGFTFYFWRNFQNVDLIEPYECQLYSMKITGQRAGHKAWAEGRGVGVIFI